MMKAVGTSLLIIGMLTGTTFAQDVNVEDMSIQMGPVFIKFQARVSQANMPVGDGTFQGVDIKLYDVSVGGQEICLEHLRDSNGSEQIPVNNGILNVEIGRAMECSDGKSFHEEVMRKSAMYLEIVLKTKNSEGIVISNDLAPRIQFGTVPYAIKANYAVHANDAQVARNSVQSLYARRMTADADVENGEPTNHGYFDFATPADSEKTGGHMVWTPNPEEQNTLTIASGRQNVNEQLETVTIKSNMTIINGKLDVTNGITMNGSIDKAKNLVGENEVTRSVEDIVNVENKVENLESMAQQNIDSIQNATKNSVAFDKRVNGNTVEKNCASVGGENEWDAYTMKGTNCAVDTFHFACFKPRDFSESSVWKITTMTGKWQDGFDACVVEFGEEYQFFAPRSYVEQEEFSEVFGQSKPAGEYFVWYNLTDQGHEGYFVSGDPLAVRVGYLERAVSAISSNGGNGSTFVRGWVEVEKGIDVNNSITVSGNVYAANSTVYAKKLDSVESIRSNNKINVLSPLEVLAPIKALDDINATRKIHAQGDIETDSDLIVGGEIRGKIDDDNIKKGTSSTPWFKETTLVVNTSESNLKCTNFLYSDYVPVIASFNVGSGDINEKNSGTIFSMYTTPSGGKICVKADFRTHGTPESIYVRLVLINKSLFIGG